MKNFNVFKNGVIVNFSEKHTIETIEIQEIMTFPEEHTISAISLKDLGVRPEYMPLINQMKEVM